MYFFEYVFAAFLITVSIVSGRAISDIGNPVAFDRSCGRPESSYVCDPDDLLTVHEGDFLDKAVSDVYHNTPCPCAQCTGPKNNSGYVIGIALVRKMETDSESQSVSVDENTSGEDLLAQQLNVQLATARNYASSLLSAWQLGHCGEAVLVFCSHDDAICYTVADTTARKKLTDDIVGEIASNSRRHASFNLTTRLEKMIHDYKLVFLNSYNRTTNWKNSGNGPHVARVVSSSQSTLYIPAPCLTAVLALLIVLSVARPQSIHPRYI